MRAQRSRVIRAEKSQPILFALFLTCLAILIAVDPVGAEDEIRLKNGKLLRGTEMITDSLTGRPVTLSELIRPKDATPVTRTIARVENGWQYFYFPVQQQVAAAKPGALPLAAAAASFKIKPPRTQIDRVSVAALGPVIFSEPFSEFGVRRITVQGPKKERELIQAITLVAPDHVIVETLNCDWKFGVALKSLPFETIEKLVRRQINPEEATDRYGLARFYMQAELYEQAFKELASIKSDFSSQKELVARVESDEAELMNYFGSEILRRLRHRQRAAQHVLAESYAKILITRPLSSTVQQDVKQYLQDYEDARQSIVRAKLLLGDWQAKVNDSGREERLQTIRSEVTEQLDFETLPRLDAFLKAELDDQYEPAQRLALAYSGWILGSANALTDLDQTFRLWDARQLALEYLRTDDPAIQLSLLKKLKSTESVSPATMLNLIPLLPPIHDVSDIQPGVIQEIELSGGKPIRYGVVLPAEYTPHHSYPLLIALRSQNRSIEETLKTWAGESGHPDLGNQRGYIVIAPEYVEKNATEYSFGAPAHEAVLSCLIDARKRFSVDSDRVYLAGHGMGADAAFDIGMAHPDEFAGVLPIGGNATNYCEYYWKNSGHTAWYIVGRGSHSNTVLNHLLKQPKFDVMLVEYIGRTVENMSDEIPKFYDWMELASHVRPPMPKQFQIRSMRKADNRFYWMTAQGLPRDNILPVPAGSGVKIEPMDFDVRIAPAANTLTLPGFTENYSIRLTPDLIDFDKQLLIRVGRRNVSNDFVKPEYEGMLEELSARGDRKRLPLAVIHPK